jgi:AraC family transcriptional regulator
MTACSWKAGWRSLLLRSYIDPPRVEEFKTPPTADQLIVLVTEGTCDIEARYRGGWQHTHYEPGHIGMTGAGQEATLRWQGQTCHSTLQLHLPSHALLTTLADLSDRDPARFDMPSQLTCIDPVIQTIMLSLADALRDGAPDLYAESAREFLVAHLLIRHAGLVSPKPVNPACQRLRRVDDFMRAHLDTEMSLEVIAREAGLSKFHTLRLFKSAYGETPIKRLTRLRMERAKIYLATGNAHITEIAFQCGYDGSGPFAAAFRRWVGVSPREYRNGRGARARDATDQDSNF